MYTAVYTAQMSHRGLLHGPGSCARYFIMTEKGEEPEKEYIYMCRFGT